MMISEGFAIVYDLRDPDGWRAGHRDRALWGKRYTEIYPLGLDHVALVFRSGGERWRAWEQVRLELIVCPDLEGRAA